jgi:hypothetical protein
MPPTFSTSIKPKPAKSSPKKARKIEIATSMVIVDCSDQPVNARAKEGTAVIMLLLAG